MDRGLCESCAHYSYHRIGRETVRERCEVVAYAFDPGATGMEVVRECIHYDADTETEVPFRGGINVCKGKYDNLREE